MEFNNKDITIGYQQIPGKDRLFGLPEADGDCVLCEGAGEVQCSVGDSFYYDDCNCVILKYWEEKGNKFMADGYKKIIANNIKLRNI